MAFYTLAYILPAAVVWGAIGMLSWWMHPLLAIILFVAGCYALLFGLFELFSVPFHAPQLAWQVPAQWIKGKRVGVQTIIWGMFLGPGLVTRNPYAGIWILPMLLILQQNFAMSLVAGLLTGMVHGATRAWGIIANRKQIQASVQPLLILTSGWRWRYLDGLVLLLVAGLFAAVLFA